MKKLANKFSKIAINCLATIATLLVAFLGVFSSPLMNVAKVMAAGSVSPSSTLTLAKLKTKVKLGNDIVVPKGSVDSGATINAEIKDPKGATLFDSTKVSEYESSVEAGTTTYTVKDSSGNVKCVVADDGTNYTLKAEKVGTYKVLYYVAQSGLFTELKTQEFKIQVTGEKATMSFEENSEYIIPSVINKNNTVILPIPTVKDSNGNDVSESDVLNRLSIKIKNATTGEEYLSANAADDYFIKKVGNHYAFKATGDESCSYIVTYTYKDNITNLETTYAPFEVKFETDFDESKIKLGYKFTKVGDGLSSIPSSFELGTETILPIASFYDENDSDFEVKGQTVVNVIFTPNEANKTKYASLVETGKDYVVVARNTNKFTPMYPSTEGTYTITYDLSSYYTIDANSTKTEAERKPDVHLIYKVTDAKDSTAPTTYVVKDYADADITSDYEIVDVSYLIPTKVKTGSTVKFPAIFAKDNVSSYAEMKESFHRVIVPEKDTNTTLENLTKPGSEEKYKFNETASYTFETAGTYTVRYEATDKANKYNYTGTTFTIVVEDDFEDTVAPRITMTSVPTSVKAGETVEYKKPTVIDYKSASSQETEVVDKSLEVYNLYYQTSTITTDESLQAELREFRKNGSSANLKLIEEKDGDSSTLSFTAISNDITVVCVAFDDSYYADETNNDGMSYEKRNIKVINFEADTVAPTFKTTDSTYETTFDTSKLKQDEQVILPNIEVADAENTRYLEGFVDVYDKNGNSVSVVGAKYSVSEDGSKMTISDAKFVATKSGEYTIVYTLSDIGGNYVIKSYVVNVSDTKAPTIELDGTISSAEIGQALRIPSVIVKDDGEVITPSKLEIVFGDDCPSYKFNEGTNEFTAREAGTFRYKYIAYDEHGNPAETAFYSFEAKDTQKPVITTDYDLDSIKTFKLEKEEGTTEYKAIELPDFVAEDVLNGIRETKVTVKSPSNKDLKVTKDDEKGVYKFTPTVDGAYTVIYSATDNANNTTELTYTIKVGDTTAPSVDFDSSLNFGKKSDVKVSGDGVLLSIDLSKISISDKGETKTAKDLINEYTNGTLKMFTITITGPDGSSITANEGTAEGVKEYTLSSSGKYTITYTARDKAGNEKIVKEFLTAYTDENKSVISTETWSIVLIVVSLAILAGVVIYFVKTRDKKPVKGAPVKLTNDKKDDKKDDKKED